MAPAGGACYAQPMLDTLAVARQLADGGVARDQAEVIAGAIHRAAEQGDHVTSDQFKAGLAELRAEIANLDTRLSGQIAEQRTEIAELRTEQRTEIAELRAEQHTGLAELRAEQRAGFAEQRAEIAELRTEQRTEIAELRTEQRTGMAELRTEQRTEIARVRTDIANLEIRLIRWMVGTVIATATLTVGILRLLG